MTTVILAIKKSIISNHPKKDSSRRIKTCESSTKKVTKKTFFSLCKHKNLIFVWWLFIKKTQERNNEWGRNKNENKYEENLVLHDMKHAVECHAILLLLFTWRMIELNFPPHLTLFFQNAQQIFSHLQIRLLYFLIAL